MPTALYQAISMRAMVEAGKGYNEKNLLRMGLVSGSFTTTACQTISYWLPFGRPTFPCVC